MQTKTVVSCKTGATDGNGETASGLLLFLCPNLTHSSGVTTSSSLPSCSANSGNIRLIPPSSRNGEWRKSTTRRRFSDRQQVRSRIDKRCRPHLQPTTTIHGEWMRPTLRSKERTDTYIGQWTQGNTPDGVTGLRRNHAWWGLSQFVVKR